MVNLKYIDGFVRGVVLVRWGKFFYSFWVLFDGMFSFGWWKL